MCGQCKEEIKYEDCIINDIKEKLHSLQSPVTGKLLNNRVILFRNNNIIGEFPVLLENSDLRNAFGKELV